MSREDRWRAIGAYAATGILSAAILAWVMRLWQADLAVPFDYLRAGDTFHIGMLVKGLRDNGWYLHNRFVGMPFGLDHHDFPLADTLHLLWLKLIGFWAGDYALTMNLYFLLTFPLCAWAALAAFRQFNVSYPPAMVGGLLFAFLPYHFWRGEMHLFMAAYYVVPLTVVVCLWICLDEPLFGRKPQGETGAAWRWVDPRGLASLIVCALAALTGAYAAFFTGFFLVVAGVIGSSRQWSLRPLRAAGILAATLFLAFLINLSPNLLYAYEHGENRMVARRSSGEAELLGLKIAQLLMPVTGHRLPALARLKDKYNIRTKSTEYENDWSSLGAIGGCGFLVLLGALLHARGTDERARLLAGLGALNLAGVLFGTIGGFGSLFAFLVTPQIRAYNRVSVFLGFFALFAVVVLLERMGQRCAVSTGGRGFYYGALGLVLAIGILDQTTPYFVPPYGALKAAYAADAEFVRRVEAALPEGAMVFQLPYMGFVENRPIYRMLDYEHFRAYLHSRALRWSYGTMKNRRGDAWQRQLVAKPVPGMVETLALAGFSGIYVDRFGYPDGGADLEAKLGGLLDESPLRSADERFAFFSLVGFASGLRGTLSAEGWERRREAALYPLLMQGPWGFLGPEGTPEDVGDWCFSRTVLYLENPSPRTKTAVLEILFASNQEAPSALRVESPWFAETLTVDAGGQRLSKTIGVAPGRHAIRVFPPAPSPGAPRERRPCPFRVRRYHVEGLEQQRPSLGAGGSPG